MARFNDKYDEEYDDDYEYDVTRENPLSYCPDIEAEFLSDEEYMSEDDEEVFRRVQKEYDHQAHLEELNKKYADSLEKCHDAVKPLLTWADSFVAPSSTKTNDELFNKKPQHTENKTQQVRKSRRFNKAVPLKIAISYGNTNGIELVQPVEVAQPTNDRLCKYARDHKKCPFGASCKFTHNEPQRNRLMTADGKSKKIWLCKNFKETNKCRFGSECGYAHSHEEVKAAVSECIHGLKCNKVKQTPAGYVNVTGQRPCNRLHPRERIANFIARTST